MVEHPGGDDAVELAVGERQRLDVADARVDRRARGSARPCAPTGRSRRARRQAPSTIRSASSPRPQPTSSTRRGAASATASSAIGARHPRRTRRSRRPTRGRRAPSSVAYSRADDLRVAEAHGLLRDEHGASRTVAWNGSGSVSTSTAAGSSISREEAAHGVARREDDVASTSRRSTVAKCRSSAPAPCSAEKGNGHGASSGSRYRSDAVSATRRPPGRSTRARSASAHVEILRRREHLVGDDDVEPGVLARQPHRVGLGRARPTGRRRRPRR